jgi:outer membrane protein OmpA-like peptidoglycan-associated protein
VSPSRSARPRTPTTPTGAADGPDTDGDGVADPDDKCPTVPETRNGYQDEDGCPDEIPLQLAKFTGTIKGIYFDKNSASIDAKSRPVLDRASAVIREFDTLTLEISGHCDSAEDEQLGQRRAEAVREYLVTTGVLRSRLKVRNGGEDEPVDTNKTGPGRAKNRRIEFTILVDESRPPPATKAAPAPSRVDSKRARIAARTRPAGPRRPSTSSRCAAAPRPTRAQRPSAA